MPEYRPARAPAAAPDGRPVGVDRAAVVVLPLGAEHDPVPATGAARMIRAKAGGRTRGMAQLAHHGAGHDSWSFDI